MDGTPVFRVGGGLSLRCADEIREHLRIDLPVIGDFAEEHDDQSDTESDEHDGQRPLAA